MTTFNGDESARLHRLWVAHFRKKHREWDRYEVLNEMYDALDWRQRQLMPELQPPSLPFPEELRDMRCDARTRAGTPCKRKDLWGSGRCKLHGGMSTGPRTKRGKRKSARNGYKLKRTP